MRASTLLLTAAVMVVGSVVTRWVCTRVSRQGARQLEELS
jgi:hypothetical protein